MVISFERKFGRLFEGQVSAFSHMMLELTRPHRSSKPVHIKVAEPALRRLKNVLDQLADAIGCSAETGRVWQVAVFQTMSGEAVKNYTNVDLVTDLIAGLQTLPQMSSGRL